MKCFLILGFLPLLALFSPESGDRPGFALPDSIPDKTVTVNSTGQNNRVVIDTLCLENAFYSDTLAAPVTGTITQTGQYNSVEINTGEKIPNSKRQITNKDQKRNHKKQKTKHKNKVIIRQNGKNNSVKINAR